MKSGWRIILIVGVFLTALLAGWRVADVEEVRAQTSLEERGFLNDWEDRFGILPPQQNNNDCVVTGCSQELCMPKGTDIDVSPCVWKPEYACYKKAACEKQSDGKCGWTQDSKLVQCVENAVNPQPVVSNPTSTPTPRRASAVCGNGVCEQGETNYWDCDACNGFFCQSQSCVLRLGTCTPDCPGVPAQPPTMTPTPTKKPKLPLSFNLRKTPTPTTAVSATPTPAPDENEDGESWIDGWLNGMGDWWGGIF